MRADKGFQLLGPDEVFKNLHDLIAGRNYITYDELLSLLPQAEEHVELVDAMLEELDNLGVSVVEREAQDESGAGDQADLPLRGRSKPVTGETESIPPDDLLSLYLAEMAREPLLTHEEEIELARRIELGRVAERTIREIDYTAQEYERLHAQVKAGQAARERLGRANTRLVVSIAKRYRGRGIPFPDLIQNGNVGLMRAVDRYDHRTGNRFSTYATWWIRQAIARAVANHGRIIRIPVHTGARMRKMALVGRRLEQERGERPTPEEIAGEMDESPQRIRQLMRWMTRPLSLEQPIGEGRDSVLGYFVEDDDTPQPEELTDDHLLSETIEALLGQLTPREERILRMRYGLHNGQTHTLKQVGQKLGLSRERVRQIEHEALAKIRLFAPDHQLKLFLDELI